MPKAVKTSTTRDNPQDSLLVLTDGRKRVLIPRPKTYRAAVDTARRHFPSIRADDMIFQTDQLSICSQVMTDIAPESWETVIGLIYSVSVVERHECAEAITPVPVLTGKGPDLALPSAEPAKITLNFSFHESVLSIVMKTDTKFEKARRALEHTLSLGYGSYYIIYDGVRISFDDTPYSHGMEDGDSIQVYLQQLGGKPVIYVYSPTETNVSVALTLTHEWSFSTIYPVVPSKSTSPGTCERIQWNVRTHLDGNLTELNTGLDVAYLFWEAHTNDGIPPSPPASPVVPQSNTALSFSPLTSDLSPADAVLIAVRDITPYLDKVLLALGLHTEARTSFITYWLPSLLRHKHVALRFVPQAAYETAASLDIEPVPDVVTRVFMLFKGIAEDALAEWGDAEYTDDDAERWRDVVGVDAERASNAALLRVLEWGGMEVLSR
ncbi:hypothetical protein GGX14DRAFT_547135 [Mycena pura]|uniref:Ubiquitin-like domain-containing protein n=1 Tax=Mycena pura TaxID=153505 RepID=A0AAD6XXB0_9AGAR|nr:hypothetical protein GGX14DRAFT_547135 [Mycena pura]